MSDVYAIINQKGGSGKSTTANNLAAAFALRPDTAVLVIDADPQKSLTYGLTDSDAPWTILTVNEGEAGSYDLLTGDPSLVNRDLQLTWMQEAISDYAEEYDVILIDCPPSLSMISIGAIYAAEKVIIPSTATYYSAAGIDELFRTIRTVRSYGADVEDVKVLLTLYERNGAVYEIERQIRDAWPTYETVIRKNVAVQYAQNAGIDVIKYDKRCNAAKDYLALCEEILTSDNR